MNKVVTRFAPSPTGSLHIGGVRTAIFAYLWSKKNKGKFLLRIEDTDRERFVEGAVQEFETSLAWLGIELDDEIIYQSSRRHDHKKFADKLVEAGRAYKCFCTKERLDLLRESQKIDNEAPGYDKRCRHLSASEIVKAEKNDTPFVIRIAIPESGKAEWQDGVRGKMSIDYATMDDQVLIKSDGWPTYFLASVIDDHDMGITDVIRGEEWLPSTPKTIAIYEALGFPVPRFSHLPVILGPDGKKKISKRDGDVAVLEYQKKGYLPEALFNFLALLGWNPGTTNEIFTKKELTDSFDLNRVQKSPAIFDIKKLDWINGQYIRRMSNDKLKMSIQKLIPGSELLKMFNFDRILEIEKTRLIKLTDLSENTDFYIKKPKLDAKLLVFKKSTPEATKRGLEAALRSLEVVTPGKWESLGIGDINNILLRTVSENNLTNGDVFWPVRYALSGLEKSPSPTELLWALGKTESEKRLKLALDKINY